MNPPGAKLKFKLRTLSNCGIVLAAFAFLAFLFSPFPWAWVADALAMGVLFYLYFYVLDKRAIGIRCPHCLKYISTNTPWICGFCQKNNEQTDLFPFVHRCEHCGAEPKAYKCHHRNCGKLIFLTEDHLEENYARCLNAPVENITATEISVEESEKRKLGHQLIMAELTAKLNEVKQRAEFSKKRTPYEKVEEDFSRHQAEVMAVHEIARDRKKSNAEKYRDDPELLERANESVDAWVTSRV